MDHFTQLKAWTVGIELAKEIYVLSRKFPADERYGLTQQVRKSSTSILANLAEGFGRFTYPDKAAKYTIARGECAETEAHVRIAIALGFITEKDAEKALLLVDMEGKLLSGLIAACRARK